LAKSIALDTMSATVKVCVKKVKRLEDPSA